MKINIFIQYYKYNRKSKKITKTINEIKNTESTDYLQLINNELKKVNRKYNHILQAIVSTQNGTPLFIVDSTYDIPMDLIKEEE
jgi:hypothetical protein